MDTLWNIEMFGSLQMRQAEQVVTRFQTYKTGALLAYLAYHRDQSNQREALAELLWPEAELESARNSLRVALTSLRRQLEPNPIPVGAVLIADRVNVRLNPSAYVTDVLLFEEALQAERQSNNEEEAGAFLHKALDLYRGPLLTNCYEDWIVSERERLADAYLGALRRLIKRLVQLKEFDRALDYARRAVTADSLREGAHRDLMRLYAAIGRPAAALQQYRELERLLHDELGAIPSAVTKELVKQISAGMSKMPTSPLVSPVVTETETQDENVSVASPPLPPPTPAPVPIGNIPIQFNRFFGRTSEVERLQDMLTPESEKCCRLVTLTGSGGAGKTRLAVEVAGRLRIIYENRIWFIPLADISDASQIYSAIVSALRLPREAEVDLIDQIVEHLRGKWSLFLLDNFEQIAEEGAVYVQTLLERMPQLNCLITSQLRVEIAGEQEVPILPLPTPDPNANVEHLMEFASIRLFMDRAQAARPDFTLTERNAPAVSTLCTRLEGIPLAIELAAAWAQMLTPAQMLERLSDRFDLLVSPRKRGLPRHRTLRAAIDWSHRLLSPELQRFFACMGVFRGSWDLDAAQTVSEDEDALEYLWQLRQRSFIVIEEGEGAMRFRMLESLREFAEEQLSGEERIQAEAMHLGYYLQLTETAELEVTGKEAALWLGRLEEEMGNLRAALENALKQEDRTPALRLGGALWRFWYGRGHVTEGRNALDRILADAPIAEPSLWIKALYGSGYLAASQGDYDRACALYARALEIARESSTPIPDSLLVNYSAAARDRGDITTARSLYQEILSRKRVGGDRWQIASALENAATAAFQQQDYSEAASLWEENLRLRRDLGDRWGEADTLMNLADLAADTPEREQALRQQGTNLFHALDDRWGIAASYINLGYLAAEQGEFASARTLQQDGLAMFRDMAEPRAIAFSLLNLARVALHQKDYQLARTALSETIALYRELHDSQGHIAALRTAADVAAQEGDLISMRSLTAEANALMV